MNKAGHINGLLNGLRLRQPFYMSKNSSMQTEQEITASSAICASEIGTSSVQITEIASTSTSSNNNTNGYQQPKTQDGNENLEEKDEDYYEYKIEMLELEVARLTKSEKKLRSEVERLCNVEESLEKLRIEFRQLDLRNWMWLKPILGEFLGCTFCTEIYIKPSVLSCNHMFCSWCIRTWMSRNSKCPTCRQEISFVTNCAELNEFILKSIESGDPDRRNEYLRISRERERDGGYRVIENSSDEEEDDSDDYSYYAY
ncbi:E3 ubiquitin-protein ligase RNF8-like [Sipha flava]|uniref:E3 ubiquitin-protein ligase RNF8-like n=2 Tax=Sipha flava TaxID=143950 RepID=A0A8B8G3R5_9HEMI|nr:E3 ubiquitin-protein ligase RNF8-like [Sipha flava]